MFVNYLKTTLKWGAEKPTLKDLSFIFFQSTFTNLEATSALPLFFLMLSLLFQFVLLVSTPRTLKYRQNHLGNEGYHTVSFLPSNDSPSTASSLLVDHTNYKFRYALTHQLSITAPGPAASHWLPQGGSIGRKVTTGLNKSSYFSDQLPLSLLCNANISQRGCMSPASGSF